MDADYITYTAVELLSAFATGTLVMAMLFEFKLRKQLFDVHFFRATLKLGVAIILGLLVWLIYPNRATQFNVPLVVYTVGLVLISVGAIGMVLRMIRIIVEEDEQ